MAESLSLPHLRAMHMYLYIKLQKVCCMRIFRAEWISLWIKIQFNSLGINRTDCIAHEKIFEKAYSYIYGD